VRACVCEREAPKNVLKKSLFSGNGGECSACDVCLREMEGGREREREHDKKEEGLLEKKSVRRREIGI